MTILAASENTMSTSSQKLASYYDGSSIEMALFKLFGFIITLCTLGIAYPWVLVMLYGKKISNTVIEGVIAVSRFCGWTFWYVDKMVVL